MHNDTIAKFKVYNQHCQVQNILLQWPTYNYLVECSKLLCCCKRSTQTTSLQPHSINIFLNLVPRSASFLFITAFSPSDTLKDSNPQPYNQHGHDSKMIELYNCPLRKAHTSRSNCCRGLGCIANN